MTEFFPCWRSERTDEVFHRIVKQRVLSKVYKSWYDDMCPNLHGYYVQ
jgi:hypothetical protein